MKYLKFFLPLAGILAISPFNLAQAQTPATLATPTTPTTPPPATSAAPTTSAAPATPVVPATPTAPSTIVANTNANQFAEQSGAIAGTAQACGQNISTLNARTIEVITLLTKIPAEQQQAMMIFQKALANAQTNQTKNPVLKCSDVIASYNSLPILKDDYKQTVLPAMARLGTGG